MCKFRNARTAFRNLHVDPLSRHTFMRNKQVEFNPYIYTLSKLYRFGYEISVFNTKHPVIILRASLFVVTPSHVASWKIECQNFSYVYRSRKQHWKCKYFIINQQYVYFATIIFLSATKFEGQSNARSCIFRSVKIDLRQDRQSREAT